MKPPPHEDPALHQFLAAAPGEQAAWLAARGLPAATLLPLRNACAQACFFCAGPGTSALPATQNSPESQIWAQLSGRPPEVQRLLIGGNEPTLHPHFERVLFHAQDLGFSQIDLMTNGATLAGKAKEWAALGLRQVVTPLYSLKAEVHDSLCGTRCFSQVWDGLEAALEAGIQVHIHSLFLRRNLDDLAALSQAVQQKFGSRLAVGLLRPKPGFDWKAEAPSFGEIRKIFAEMQVKPILLVAPRCLAWGEGEGILPGFFGEEEEEPALLAELYFSSQKRIFLDGCRGCPSRERCDGVVEGYGTRA